MNLRSSSGRTPLLEAVFGRQLEIARILIDAGADIDICDTKGTSVLHHMCFDRRPSMYFIRYLLSSKLIHKWTSTLLKRHCLEIYVNFTFLLSDGGIQKFQCLPIFVFGLSVCLSRSCYHLWHLSQNSSNWTAS